MEHQQAAVLVREIGARLELGSRTTPSPGPNQVLVAVKATMILPHDAESRDQGLFIAGKLPYVLGGNIAGVIEQIGSAVSSFQPGDQVFGITTFGCPTADQGGLQQYAILEANAVSVIPPNFSYEEVATIPTNLVTSTSVLFTPRGFCFPPWYTSESFSSDYKSEALVVLAAGTNVGKFAVQLASMVGIGTIITVAGASSKEQLLQMGATHFFDRRMSMEEIVSSVHAVTGVDGVTTVYDCYNTSFEMAAALLSASKQSKLRALHPVSEQQATLLSRDRSLCDVQFIGASNGDLEPFAVEFWKGVYSCLKAGKILPTAFRTINGLHNVAEINQALDDYRDGKPGSQVVVCP